MQWSHSTLGQFDITDQWISLDYKLLFLDPVRAEITVFHELSHAILSKTTEMGQATQNIFFFSQWFKHLSEEEKDEMLGTLVSSQKFPQEGFASFMEMQQLRKLTNWETALGYKADMHPEYLERFEKMEFIFNQKHSFRDNYTKKVSGLVMGTALRRDAPQLDLLANPENLKRYLENPDNNPTVRLEKVLAALRSKPRLVLEKPRKLARSCGIKFFDPATKEEISAYVNYLLRLSNKSEDYTPELVDGPINPQALTGALENLIISNVNLDLKSADKLMRTEDIEYEARYARAAFVIQHPKVDDEELKELEKRLGRKLEYDLLMFGKRGEKYLTITSREHLGKLLANELEHATLMTKWGITNPEQGTFEASDAHAPDIIQYNLPANMLETFAKFPDIQNYRWLHIGASQNHPFQAIVVIINNHPVIHYANSFGNTGIGKVIEYMDTRGGSPLKPSDLLPYATAINDLMSFLGLSWDIDWVRTMIDQKNLIRR